MSEIPLRITASAIAIMYLSGEMKYIEALNALRAECEMTLPDAIAALKKVVEECE